MAALTTAQNLHEIRQASHRSEFVRYIEERTLDIDVLHVRVHLTLADTFINAFYNIETGKTAFALIQQGQRTYGVDNAKIGWHCHPFHAPEQHINCAPMTFVEFLEEVERYLDAN